MASNNSVHIEGVVKRDSQQKELRNGVRVMDFCLSVRDPLNDNMNTYIDCFAATDAVDELEGYVEEGERLAVDGFLTFRTMTDYKGRRKSALIVNVEHVEEIGE